MKKILILLLTALLLLGLTACGEDGSETTGSTPEATKPHTHDYTGEVTTAATCDKEGVKTFTCACGDSYTEKIDATGEHTWGNWKTETEALIGRDGTQTRTCSACAAAESRRTTEGALQNSFGEYGIERLMEHWPVENGWAQEVPLQEEAIRGFMLLHFVSAQYNGPDRTDEEFTISFDAVVEFLSPYFYITESIKAEMKQDYRYDAATDRFNLNYPGSGLNMDVRGYVHNGGNRYTVYYYTETPYFDYPSYWKVEIEFLLPEGQPNKYLSIIRIPELPENITK
ncbi:MAG: hypothetical protein IJN25_09915 [Clostridia bacterium]|nr:hypothetical protein [Oscillospiraceae bacterium]MBQ7033955.1 hypothetical protein [Clostridia bacterium]